MTNPEETSDETEEINEWRKAFLLAFQDARKQWKKAFFKRDKLFVGRKEKEPINDVDMESDDKNDKMNFNRYQ